MALCTVNVFVLSVLQPTLKLANKVVNLFQYEPRTNGFVYCNCVRIFCPTADPEASQQGGQPVPVRTSYHWLCVL